MVNDLSRRDVLKLSAAGVLGTSMSGWFNTLAGQAGQLASQGVKHKSCILLWMNGGPAQSHTFDLKPGGEYKPIATSVPGIEICEYLPQVAKHMDSMVLLRGMSTGESSHRRARYLMHTGYRQGAGGTVYPSIGAIASRELGQAGFELPNFVAINGPSFSAGYLGPKHAPVVVADPSKGVQNLNPATSIADLDERASLLAEMDRDLESYRALPVEAHQKGYERAMQLLHSKKAKAFDISQEPESVRAAYGKGRFGEGCLLARRLVEAGVPFVEVVDAGKWDTHSGAGGLVKKLLGPVDPAWATLLSDLKDRGLLDSTLVVWMGEFGRTPVNGKGHFSKAWSTVLCGGGLKTGQVVGKTDKIGGTVEDRPVRVPDFLATLCKGLGIDPTKQYRDRNGRPFRIVDKGAKLVEEIF